MGCPPNFLVAVSHNVFHALTNCYSYTRNIAASLLERLKSISDMVSNGGDLASCVFCDFCVSDANYQEHLQVRAVPVSKSDLRHNQFDSPQIMFCPKVWHNVSVGLEEDALRVLGLPLNILNTRVLKDEFLGDGGDGLSSCVATSMQEPVREACVIHLPASMLPLIVVIRRLLESVGGNLMRTFLANLNMI